MLYIILNKFELTSLTEGNLDIKIKMYQFFVLR